MPKLRKLDLSATSVTDAGAEKLREFNGLTELSVRHTKISAAAVKGLRKALPSCRIFY